MGDYLEQIFPIMGVRVIAINSQYDSNNYIGKTMGLEMSISNLVNTLYSRDLSKKYKSCIQTKWKQGVSTGGNIFCKFGKEAALCLDKTIIYTRDAGGNVTQKKVYALSTQANLARGKPIPRMSPVSAFLWRCWWMRTAPVPQKFLRVP